MNTKKEAPSAQGSLTTLLIKDIPKHYSIIHPKKYKDQPDKKEMAYITNALKRRGVARRYEIKELFDAFSNGQSVILCNAELDENNRFRFISSSVFALDVDDDNEQTDPTAVLQSLSDLAVGLFYTFSHGKKGNRYRLVFQLDRPVTDEYQFKLIIELLADQLIKKGVPVDRQARTPTTPIRTGVQGYIINDYDIKLNTTEWLSKAKKEQARRAEEAFDALENSMKYKVTFEELKEMAETIGYIPSGSGQGEEWKRIVIGIKHYANSGAISQEEGFELFDIISGGEQSEKAWHGLHANGRATIGSMIHYAKTKGYKWKPYRYALSDRKPDIKTEHHKVKGYIPAALAKELVERKQRLLIDSPTGSGKTEAFVTAFKELSNSNKQHYYIFSAPTRALTEQIAKKYEVMAVKGQDDKLFSRINEYTKAGNRVFIATYDMTPILIDCLTRYDRMARFSLVVDEIHKYVTDYDFAYRHNAINELHKASQKASSFIGLSGTTSDILKAEFDAVIQIDNGKAASPCNDFAVYTYEKKKDALPMLIQLIEAWTKERKLLVFIQSKEKIKQLQDVLRKRGIVVRTVTASEKRNGTYKDLIEREEIADEVQVVLATSVIADGINIINAKKDSDGNPLLNSEGQVITDVEWECITVCNDFSSLFNVSTLKQISNRFRGKYRRFSVFMQEPKQKETDIFNIDAAYQYILQIAERFTELMNTQFEPKNLALFHPSILEREYGIYSNGEEITVNTLHLRHTASKEQEKYYAGRRMAFIHALERTLHKKHIGILNINEAVREKKLDVSALEQQIEAWKEEKQQEKEVQVQSIQSAFTLEVYRAFKENDEKRLNEFKKAVQPMHYSCLNRLHEIAGYEICKKIVAKVKRDADTHKFRNSIKALIDISYFTQIHRETATRKVFFELRRLEEFIPSADLKELTEKTIPKRLKLRKDNVKKVMSMFIQKHKRIGKDRKRHTKLEPLTIESVAEQYDLTIEEVKECMKGYLETQPKTVQIAACNHYKL